MISTCMPGKLSKYSEIGPECEEIVHDLVSLVEAKSFSKLVSELSDDLDDSVGIGIFDPFEVLSVSKGAYDQLVQGADPKAIKHASIIQRRVGNCAEAHRHGGG